MIIKAHSVPTDASTGLSPMQTCLLRSDQPVRLVAAPTGTGKSFAFMQAVLIHHAHVLFIVPTRRLLQNLVQGAYAESTQHFRKQGWSEDQIEAWQHSHIVDWSGNQLADRDDTLYALRARQLLDAGGPGQGRILFAIPEVVVRMCAGIPVAGAATVTPFTYVRQFDHVVFDEFHTIDDRAFGLAALFAMLAVSEGRAKVSLLSATPVDVRGIFARMGVAAEHVELIEERVQTGHPPGHRPIHGDVEIALLDCELVESVTRHLSAVRKSIDQGNAVIIIYDSLYRLQQEEVKVRQALGAAGVEDRHILNINSLDDSERKAGESRRGHIYADPNEYQVLLCTSSVEIGVTFRSTLMFMEPGFNIAGFVQRVGRVARGATAGQVLVSLSTRRRERDQWVRDMADLVEDNSFLTVQEFAEGLLRASRHRWEPAQGELTWEPESGSRVPNFYQRPSWRGVYWASLFMSALLRHRMLVQKGAANRLRDIAPKYFWFVDSRIRTILAVERVNQDLPTNKQPHRQWIHTLLQGALAYRDIGASIEVIDPDGSSHTVTESFLRRNTTLLQQHITQEGDSGPVIYLQGRTLKHELAASGGSQIDQNVTWYILSPIDQRSFPLVLKDRDTRTNAIYTRLVSAWQQHFEKFLQSGLPPDDPQATVLAAATDLVKVLGKPPLDEIYEDGIGESAMFA